MQKIMELYELVSEDGGKYAANAEPVSLGEGTGKIEVIRDCDSCEYLSDHTEPRLFAAENISRNLRPLLSLAKGFIFKSGDNLNHLSNVIRYNNIPACISEELWKIAVQNEYKQFKFKSKQDKKIYANYQKLYTAFYDNIKKSPFQIPIINVQTLFRQKLSDKVLSVNQLLYLGYPVPRSVLIAGLENSIIDANEILRQVPRWFTNADKLMVRPSLCGGTGINIHVSGLTSSKTVSGMEQLLAQLAFYQRECALLSQKYGLYHLSVLIQEYIPPKSNGVMFTRIPWDYSADRFILQLSSKIGLLRYNQAYHNLEIEDNVELNKIVRDCFGLSDYFSVPLEVEFVLTENNGIYIVQFRPIFVV